ncbi:SPFH domain-containing protein [Robinsoniella peoriensis]|uniref:slipin family protein n=1 Tax=Robinsoniella peoriensis TaxID=180332 RepID=UPI003753089B
MRIIIQENQRGLLFKNGKFVKLLEAGRYFIFGTQNMEIVQLDQPLTSETCSPEVLLRNEKVARQTATVDVADEELALHFINGKFEEILRRGKYAYWSVIHKHEFTKVSIKAPEVPTDIPQYIFSKIPSYLYSKIEVKEYQKALLYYDQKLVKLLDAGTYYYWNCSTKVDYSIVDTRLTQMDINGQEILSQDKVALRINFVCTYRITDYVKIFTEIDNYEEQMHVAAQFALRDYISKYRIDEILENKEQISTYVFEKLKEKSSELYVEITDAGVKDIILPGEIRDIMNTVLIAEKRAQANVITRREEVASTRSLLNTARLMDENTTLYKLKELEYLEKICENVGNISVNGSSGLLTQLTAILHGGSAS